MAQLVHPGSINGNGNGTAATASTALEGTTRVGDSDGLSIEDTLNQLLAGVSPDLPTAAAEQDALTTDRQQGRNTDDELYTRLELLQLSLRARTRLHRARIAALSSEISAAQAADQMSLAQERITELFTEIHHLRAGATESEIIVREITRDIRNLDLAKKNITNSITGIKRFQMLVVAYEQLRKLANANSAAARATTAAALPSSAAPSSEPIAESRRYKEAAQALSAVKELANHFRTYSSIERISTVLRGIQEIQGTLRSQVMKDFEMSLGRGREAHASESLGIAALGDGCRVIEAIGDDARQSLLEWYCNQILRDYRRIFRPSEEAGQLDNLSRRFAWFRRALKTNFEDEGHSRIFPDKWKCQACLCGAFAALTRDDLKSVLVRVASGLNVTKLLEALNMTTEFEHDMERKLGMKFDKIASMSPSAHGSPSYTISSVFEAYLGIFVDAQDRSLSEMIQTWRTRKAPLDSATPPVGDGADADSARVSPVLPSSMELFHFYRETLERCAQLSTRATFLELCSVYKKWLKVYAEEVLGGYLSKGGQAASIDNRRGSSSDGRLNQREIVNACMVLNTADYCAETTSQLEERLKQKIHPDFRDRVSLETERDLFSTVTTTAILSLLKELEFACEPSFNAMLRSPWRDSSIVSSESSYVLELVQAVNRVGDLVKTEVEHRKYFRSFCDKAVGLLLTRFTQALVRARPISALNAEQILLDLQRLKSCLLQLPKMAGEGGSTSAALASYNRVVAKTIGRVDIMLQVIMCPESPPEAFVDHYLVLIPCQSFSDFQKMLDLKGVRRNDQNNLLDIFLAKTSLLRDLSDTSVLSGIEMDGSGLVTTSSNVHAGSGNSGVLGFQGITMPTSPNSALAHNLNLFMGSLPMLHGHSMTSTSGAASRVGTPQMGYTSSQQGGSASASSAASSAGAQAAHAVSSGVASFGSGVSSSAADINKAFGFKKIGRLFSHTSSAASNTSS